MLEERGGLVKISSCETSNPVDVDEAKKYFPWVQHAQWFDDAGLNCQSCPYSQVQKTVSGSQLKGLYEKDSDFEDLKSCAEFAYFSQDYRKSAELWKHLLGKYKIGSYAQIYLPAFLSNGRI